MCIRDRLRRVCFAGGAKLYKDDLPCFNKSERTQDVDINIRKLFRISWRIVQLVSDLDLSGITV